MKKIITGLAAAALLAGCGSAKTHQRASALQSSAQTKQGEAYAQRVAEQCLSKGGGWKAEIRCAVPPHHGAAFLRCAVDNKPANVHDQSADEGDLVKCGEKYR